MASHLTGKPRRTPKQERGRSRVASLLEAAANLFAEQGYDRVTMSAIADRAQAPIGSLYQFFPNKEAVAEALRASYEKECRNLWAHLEPEAEHLTTKQLADRLIDLQVEFMEQHPALLSLLDKPKPARPANALKNLLERRIASLLVAGRPTLSRTEASGIAIVVLRVTEGLFRLFGVLQPRQRKRFASEFKLLLFCYLKTRLQEKSRAN
jgi:AcrR family transcriptional regulator